MKLLGLKRHTVCLAQHDPEWAAVYAREAQAIWEAAGELVADVQHVGSTAVPGLPAKPILDVAIAVRVAKAVPELVRRLVAIGYLDRGDSGSDGGYLLVRDSEPEVRVAHVHIVRQDDPQWRNYLAFRDLLRRDAAVREQYAALKQELAARFPDDRRSYTDGKHEFIRGALAA